MKKKHIPMTKEQQDLVTSHLSIVQWVIREYICINENAYGYGYDDFFQEGCMWLCHAAMTYDVALSQFGTYAKTVVRNGLFSYCRQLQLHRDRLTNFSEGENGEIYADGNPVTAPDTFEQQLSFMETMDLLESRVSHYNGVARLGIKALELKIKGLSVTEIARLYNVPASHVGAWITRSTKKLRNDPVFLKDIT